MHAGNGGKTKSFTTTKGELMDALQQAGLGFLVDTLDIAYTKKGRCRGGDNQAHPNLYMHAGITL
jgi:hypothetical protein